MRIDVSFLPALAAALLIGGPEAPGLPVLRWLAHCGVQPEVGDAAMAKGDEQLQLPFGGALDVGDDAVDVRDLAFVIE